MKRLLILTLTVALLGACKQRPVAVTDAPAPIYPDYADVTIPVNVAPLNFMLTDSAQGAEVTINGEPAASSCNGKITFGRRAWRQLMARYAGQTVSVVVSGIYGDSIRQYRPFRWTIAADSIDRYLTYRLIEPDYEVFQHLELRERCLENFDERAISTYHLTGNRCMNCHTYGSNSANRSMLYVRGEGGGALLNEGGTLRKLDLRTPDMVSSSVYFAFSPNGRYIVFSTNIIVPAFHSNPQKRLEVFDSRSDVYVADVQTRRVLHIPALADSSYLETFPTFAPDGHSIWFCRARVANSVEALQYDLCRLRFDEATGLAGDTVETILAARAGEKSSVSHPKLSPDGSHLLFTVAHYGTFPIWHPEADLRMLDLQNGHIDSLQAVNSPLSDTWHAWSANGRWFVFASKRDDGLYGKPYFCYVDRNGRAHKPFVLPQRDPDFYRYTLKSFNLPELGRDRLPFNAADVARALRLDAEPFTRDTAASPRR